MTQQHTETAEPTPEAGFTAESFAGFWANPDPALVPEAVTEDVVGHWPGSGQPVRGVVDYAEKIGQVLELIPDLSLRVLEHATSGDLLFIRWLATGTGIDGPFEFSGIDRIRIENDLVKENVIVFDTAEFERLVGRSVPQA